MKVKNKKSLIAIVALFLVIGVTIAYFTSSASFENIFNTGTYKVVTTEVFESPDNWKPGEEIPKTITTKNEGTIPAAVRVSLTEKWEDSNGVDITTSIPTGAVVINLDNTGQWTKVGNYYYYNYILEPNETTSSFIKSVTLNAQLGSGDDVDCTPSADGLSVTCEATDPLYGAKYKLTLTKETVQADKYQEVWNTNFEITDKPPLVQIMNSDRTKDTLEFGDEICINGGTTECFNVLGYDGDNVKMLAKYNLNVGDNIQPGVEGIQNSLATGYNGDSSTRVNGHYPTTLYFSTVNYWYNGNHQINPKYGSSYPIDVYDTDYSDASGNNHSVAYYVVNYKNKLEQYGLYVQDARLLTYSEATDSSIGCDHSNYSCPTGTFITNSSYWLGTSGDNTAIYTIRIGGTFMGSGYANDTFFGVRPVIVISKSDM